MKFIYDKVKADKLLKERKIDLKEIEALLLREGYIALIQNKARIGQYIMIVKYKGYIYALPCLFDKAGNIVIKTAYPTRKYNKRYGGNYEN